MLNVKFNYKRILLSIILLFTISYFIYFLFLLYNKVIYLSYNNRYLIQKIEQKDRIRESDTKARKMQLIQTQYLKAIDILFTKNNIPYFIEGGTLLGAARNQGFIPWDDDIDYAVIGQKNCDKAAHLLGKYSIERYRYNQTDMACAYYIKPELEQELLEEHKLLKYTGNLKKIPILRSLTLWHRNKIKEKYISEEPTSIIAFDTYLKGRLAYSNFIFKNLGGIKRIKFENIFVNAPGNHDAFLTKAYGDWESYSEDFGKMFHNTYPHVKDTSYFKYTHKELDLFLEKANKIVQNIEKI